MREECGWREDLVGLGGYILPSIFYVQCHGQESKSRLDSKRNLLVCFVYFFLCLV
jgi:hypothetical protein